MKTASSISNINLPTLIFCDRRFAFAESLIYHLKNMGLTYHEIAVLLNRNDRTVWTWYHRALHKTGLPAALQKPVEEVMIPTQIFRDRSVSIMEALIEHLRHHYTHHQIAAMLNRNDRTIWTVNSRAQKKRIRV